MDSFDIWRDETKAQLMGVEWKKERPNLKRKKKQLEVLVLVQGF